MQDDQDGCSYEQEQREGLQHVGYNALRAIWEDPSAILERSFAHHWMRVNAETIGFLGKMLESYVDDDSMDGAEIKVSQRDARVAATVVQWLGTNVGLSFLVRAMNEAGYQVKYPVQP